MEELETVREELRVALGEITLLQRRLIVEGDVEMLRAIIKDTKCENDRLIIHASRQKTKAEGFKIRLEESEAQLRECQMKLIEVTAAL